MLQNPDWIQHFWISSVFPVMQEKRLSARLYLYLNSVQDITQKFKPSAIIDSLSMCSGRQLSDNSFVYIMVSHQVVWYLIKYYVYLCACYLSLSCQKNILSALGCEAWCVYFLFKEHAFLINMRSSCTCMEKESSDLGQVELHGFTDCHLLYWTFPLSIVTFSFSEMNCTNEEKTPQTSVKCNSFEALKSYPFVN